MARIEDTGGNVTYTIDNCDCGLTGGCARCQPIVLKRPPPTSFPSVRFYPDVVYEMHEERFMDENLKAFYRKRGLLYESELKKGI